MATHLQFARTKYVLDFSASSANARRWLQSLSIHFQSSVLPFLLQSCPSSLSTSGISSVYQLWFILMGCYFQDLEETEPHQRVGTAYLPTTPPPLRTPLALDKSETSAARRSSADPGCAPTLSYNIAPFVDVK